MPDDRWLGQLVGDVRKGWIPAAIYSDPGVFEAEEERVFGRAWVFLAHESEIPEPGDYVVRGIVRDSFIVARDEYG
ncbi:MAG: aromatic ring-hydroxylating dioxygenase subunit alpha, partial [Armatimonadota bacterium]|nr:aromatic ring-hydroxylating dioxygenase subunit alpha [Armatimonadota bacterium]